jgi:hypothetical protein
MTIMAIDAATPSKSAGQSGLPAMDEAMSRMIVKSARTDIAIVRKSFRRGGIAGIPKGPLPSIRIGPFGIT